MVDYPKGAGPTAGAFTGQVWTSAADGTVPAPLPFILSANGPGEVTFTAPASRAWMIHRIVVQSDTAGPARVYVGGTDPTQCVSGSYAGEFDENDANQPYYVPAGQDMTVVWEQGGACTARIEYAEIAG